MKITRILSAAIVLFIISSTSVFAQGMRLSIGVELGMPMGDFGDISNMGFGGSARVELPMGDNLGLTGTIGYLSFGGKTPDGAPSDYKTSSLNFIPIMVGAKYYFQEQQSGFYGAVAVGMTSSSSSAEGSESSTDFTWAPGVGYHLDNLDFGVNYNNISAENTTLSYLGVRIAYAFGGK